MTKQKPGSLQRWALQDAKNRFSEVVDAAVRGEPQLVTRRGHEAAVVLGHDDYARLTAARHKGRTLGEYLATNTATARREPFERIRMQARDAV